MFMTCILATQFSHSFLIETVESLPFWRPAGLREYAFRYNRWDSGQPIGRCWIASRSLLWLLRRTVRRRAAKVPQEVGITRATVDHSRPRWSALDLGRRNALGRTA
jgi:hypothetical protein